MGLVGSNPQKKTDPIPKLGDLFFSLHLGVGEFPFVFSAMSRKIPFGGMNLGGVVETNCDRLRKRN